jgi:hypothetical protein
MKQRERSKPEIDGSTNGRRQDVCAGPGAEPRDRANADPRRGRHPTREVVVGGSSSARERGGGDVGELPNGGDDEPIGELLRHRQAARPVSWQGRRARRRRTPNMQAALLPRGSGEDIHQDRRPAARRDEARVCRTSSSPGSL